jgi:hypothetical protein
MPAARSRSGDPHASEKCDGPQQEQAEDPKAPIQAEEPPPREARQGRRSRSELTRGITLLRPIESGPSSANMRLRRFPADPCATPHLGGPPVSDQSVVGDIEVDKQNLYREETFTDLKVASIRRLTPILADGADDPSRSPRFIGETTLMSQRGPLPVQAPIEAKTLSEAFDLFPEAVNQAVDALIEQAREMQRQEASRIVVPGQMPPPGRGIIG